ncbi:RES family NAD+ phosphorylase [Chroococcidiopsis sp. FACHB-1243]|uniref:RES family NAD+ phosphorylase n=1 Tax=Chroococcidiopsis sp. [FACHB-1243] TaxID=2692781 RepID=UPI001780E215|nr:RES family NAD+ phosphorylase [Chroococcidiopsis sp. [FACHB-1243]]MBD2305651.1 RES family NAD+ phosphorylase [Chroococcidiopsis sp. [FACHB-1243]]
MSVRVWRICNAKWAATAFDGQGAKTYGGRWNPTGVAVVYTSSSLALAAFELLVHLGVKTTPKPHVAIPADIPEQLSIDSVLSEQLPSDWRDDPPPPVLAIIGSQWIRNARSAVLKVPSAVIDEEWNYLLNPTHPDFTQIALGKAKPFEFDTRLFSRDS